MPAAINRRRFNAAALSVPATLALPSWAQSTATSDRVALVVGNSDYSNAALPNAKSDAASISTVLREMGFDVVFAQDANRMQMRTAFEELGKKLAGRNATALFYFAGHGLQVDWRNFLMPVDAAPTVAANVAAWHKAKDATDAEPLIEFLRAYPSGRFTEFAQFRLDQISKPVVAQPGKGEVAPPSPGSMRYRVGDHFVCEQVDSWERAPTRYDWLVTKADEHTAELANGQVIYTQSGAILRSRFGVFEPGSLVAPADISLGKCWKSAFRQTRLRPPIVEDVKYDFRAAAKESITVPAGKFDCFRVEGIGRAQGAGPTSTWTNSLEITFWIDVVSMISIERKLADPAIGQMGTTLTRNS